jgi:hypothetical protein
MRIAIVCGTRDVRRISAGNHDLRPAERTFHRVETEPFTDVAVHVALNMTHHLLRTEGGESANIESFASKQTVILSIPGQQLYFQLSPDVSMQFAAAALEMIVIVQRDSFPDFR